MLKNVTEFGDESSSLIFNIYVVLVYFDKSSTTAMIPVLSSMANGTWFT